MLSKASESTFSMKVGSNSRKSSRASKFVNHLGGIGPGNHVQLVDMVDEQVLHSLSLVTGRSHSSRMIWAMRREKGSVEEDVAEHDLRIGPRRWSRPRCGRRSPQAHAPFVSRVLRVLRRVIGAVLVESNGVVDEVKLSDEQM